MLFICQVPMYLPPKVWAAASAVDAIGLIESAHDNAPPFASVLEAAQYDMRDAYVTDDVIDLLLWIEVSEAARATHAKAASLQCADVRFALEDMAIQEDDGGDVVWRAFDGRFRYRADVEEWTIDNQPPVEAVDLHHALAAAAIHIELAGRTDHVDV